MGCAAEVERAVQEGSCGSVDEAQARRQQAAFIYLTFALASQLSIPGWHRQAAALHERLAEFTQCHFGGAGPGPGLRVFDHECRAITDTGHADRSPAVIPRLLEKSQEARQRGLEIQAAGCFFDALAFANWFGGPQDRERLRAQASPLLEVVPSEPHPGIRAWWYKALFEASVADGLFDEAERLLPEVDGFFRDRPHMLHVEWAKAMGEFALRRGDYDEAQRHFEDGLAAAKRWELEKHSCVCAAWLLNCDLARKGRPLINANTPLKDPAKRQAVIALAR